MKIQKTFKITKLNKAETAFKGMLVPKEKNGNIGSFVHDHMHRMDYPMSSTGVDIPSLDIEVKSKGIESTSAHTIGSMTYNNIKKFAYDDSELKDKCQRHFKVTHNQTFREIIDAKVYDFTRPDIQEKFRYAYNSGRDLILQGCEDNYIRGDGAWGYFERKKKQGKPTSSWMFRFPVKSMTTLEGMAKSNFSDLFS